MNRSLMRMSRPASRKISTLREPIRVCFTDILLGLRMLDEGTFWRPQKSSAEVAIDITEVTTHSYA